MSHNWTEEAGYVMNGHGTVIGSFGHPSDAVTAVRAVNELGPLLVEIEALRAENESLNSGQCVDALVSRIIELNAERTQLLAEVEELRDRVAELELTILVDRRMAR